MGRLIIDLIPIVSDVIFVHNKHTGVINQIEKYPYVVEIKK